MFDLLVICSAALGTVADLGWRTYAAALRYLAEIVREQQTS